MWSNEAQFIALIQYPTNIYTTYIFQNKVTERLPGDGRVGLWIRLRKTCMAYLHMRRTSLTQIQNTAFKFVWFVYILTTFAGKIIGISGRYAYSYS